MHFLNLTLKVNLHEAEKVARRDLLRAYACSVEDCLTLPHANRKRCTLVDEFISNFPENSNKSEEVKIGSRIIKEPEKSDELAIIRITRSRITDH